MPSLKNTHANMEIGYVWQVGKAKLYIQVGSERKYYGTLSQNKAHEFWKCYGNGTKQEVTTDDKQRTSNAGGECSHRRPLS